eukprot:3970117-Prymnesium_polylepis.1
MQGSADAYYARLSRSSLYTADDSVFGAHRRDDQLDAQQRLDSHRGLPETRMLEKIKGSAALLGEALIDRFRASPKQAACSLSRLIVHK